MQATSAASLSSLVDGLALKILCKLSWRDLSQLRTVSKRFKELATDNTLWEGLYKEAYHDDPPAANTTISTGNQLMDYRMRHQRNFYQKDSNYNHYKQAGWNGLRIAFISNKLCMQHLSLQTREGGSSQVIVASLANFDTKSITVVYANGTIVEWNWKEDVQLRSWALPLQEGQGKITAATLYKGKAAVGTDVGDIFLFSLENEQGPDGHSASTEIFHVRLPPDMDATPKIAPSVNCVYYDGRLVLGSSKVALKMHIWDIDTRAPVDFLRCEYMFCNAGILVTTFDSVVRVSRLEFNDGKFRRVDTHALNGRKALNRVHPYLSATAPVMSTACDFRDYILAAHFKDVKEKKIGAVTVLNNTPPFDIILIWNMKKPMQEPLVYKLITKNASVKSIRIDKSLEKVVCMLTNGKFYYLSTVAQNTRVFESDDIAGAVQVAEVLADRLIIGSKAHGFNAILFAGQTLADQTQRVTQSIEVYRRDGDKQKSNVSILDWVIYLRQKAHEVEQAHKGNLSSDEILSQVNSFVALFDLCANEMNSEIRIFQHLVDRYEQFKKVKLLMSDIQDWASSIRVNLESLSFSHLLNKLMEEDEFERKIEPFKVSFPFLLEPLTATLEPLRRRTAALASKQLEQFSNEIDDLGQIHPGNFLPADRLRAQLNSNPLFDAKRKPFSWMASSEEFMVYHALKNQIELKLGEYYASQFREKLQFLRSSIKSEVLSIEEFWEEWDRVDHQMSGLLYFVGLLPKQVALSLDSEKKAIFEEMAQHMMQVLDTEIASIRQRMKQEGLTLNKGKALVSDLQLLAQNALASQLQRRNPNYHATIMGLLQVNMSQLQSDLGVLKEVELSQIASVMEQIEQLNTTKMSKDEILLKCDQFKELLDQYSGANPDWAEIGKGRLEEMQQDILNPKLPQTDDFYLYDDDMYEDLEDGMGDEDEEGEDEGEEDPEED